MPLVLEDHLINLLTGEPYANETTKEPLTVAEACRFALLEGRPIDERTGQQIEPPPTERYARWVLAQRITQVWSIKEGGKGGKARQLLPLTVSTEEIELLRKCSGQAFRTGPMGALWQKLADA